MWVGSRKAGNGCRWEVRRHGRWMSIGGQKVGNGRSESREVTPFGFGGGGGGGGGGCSCRKKQGVGC